MPPERHVHERHGRLDRTFARFHRMRASDALLLKAAIIAAIVFLSIFLARLSLEHTVRVPAEGGTFKEGIVGTPRFANPVLAVTRADRDLTTLIYDGLMKLGSEGVLVPNIAKSVTVSEDGLTYNVILREDVKFHDGDTLTARDVAFTVGRIQDPLLTSPLRSSFDGVVAEEVGEFELNFALPEPYAHFTENLTFGILPEHIWKDAGSEEFPFSQYNSEPIGAGPYRVEKIMRNTSGIPETYILHSYEEYHQGAPKIERFEMHFYPSEERLIQAFEERDVKGVVGVDPSKLPEYQLDEATHHLEHIPLPRTFAVFFNQNKSSALRDSAARRALDVALDRDALVQAVVGGYGKAITTPIPPGFGVSASTSDRMYGLDAAREILRSGGWEVSAETGIWEKTIDKVKVPLTFSIATVNNRSFETAAEFLRTTWEKLGAKIDVKQFEQSDLTQAVIRPRDYEALLFGTQLGRSLDFYSFWHSSQRMDPGLNIALYTNITIDSILAEMRRTSNVESRNEAINKFVAELGKETPAIFLYTPELVYIFPNDVIGASFTGVGDTHERFSGVTRWYMETESVWPIFTK